MLINVKIMKKNIKESFFYFMLILCIFYVNLCKNHEKNFKKNFVNLCKNHEKKFKIIFF